MSRSLTSSRFRPVLTMMWMCSIILQAAALWQSLVMDGASRLFQKVPKVLSSPSPDHAPQKPLPIHLDPSPRNPQ